MTRALAGPYFDFGSISYFAGAKATYYLDANFSVSANAAIAASYNNWSELYYMYPTAGAEVRYKFADMPLILSASYLYELEDIENPSVDYFFLEQRASVGLRVPFGAGSQTLRELDRATGLELYSDYYGR